MGKSIVVGIGEVLWDVFPEGKRLGGAPVNFACHCNQLGATGLPVSCLGRDALGMEIRAVLNAMGVDQTYVADDAEHPTGTVQVTLDAAGKPSYEICEGVAWDVIPFSDELAALAAKTDAVCFGSLAQRAPVSAATIHAFLSAMRPDAVKIFDVNLRQAFFTQAAIEASLRHANVLKLSDEELPVLAEMFDVSGTVPEQLEALRNQWDLRLVAYTRGAEGSLLLAASDCDEHGGHPAHVVDSVGAGDSFTAALCMGLLRERPIDAINDHANRVAAYVCSQQGATPELPAALCAAGVAER
jgi:fructokinase